MDAMSYTVINFKTKKALKEAWTEWAMTDPTDHNRVGKAIRCYNPGLGPDLSNYTGRVSLEGPHYPAAHKWYCEGEMVNGILVKVS